MARGSAYCEGLGIPILFAEAKVDDVHHVQFLSNAHQEVVRLDVAVQEVFRVHVLYPAEHLIREHEHSLEAEFPIAEIK
jgi:hypothetical protein